MKNTIITLASVAALAGAANAQTHGTYLDWTRLGANAAKVASASGQTFTDIGTTLGRANLVGVNLTAKYTYDGSGNQSFAINGLDQTGAVYAGPGPATGNTYRISNGTVSFTFSSSVLASQFGGKTFTEEEQITYGGAASGSLISSHIEPGLIVRDDGVVNTSGIEIVGAENTLWDGLGTVFTKSHSDDISASSEGSRFAATTVPEPSSSALLGLGALGLLARRKR